MTTVWIALAAIIELVGWVGFVISQEPENAGEGAFMLVMGWFMWPFFLLGWFISRPFA